MSDLDILAAYLSGKTTKEVAKTQGVTRQAIQQKLAGSLSKKVVHQWPSAPKQFKRWRWYPRQVLAALAGRSISQPVWIERREAAWIVFKHLNSRLHNAASNNQPDAAFHLDLVAWRYDADGDPMALEALILGHRSEEYLVALVKELLFQTNPRETRIHQLGDTEVDTAELYLRLEKARVSLTQEANQAANQDIRLTDGARNYSAQQVLQLLPQNIVELPEQAIAFIQLAIRPWRQLDAWAPPGPELRLPRLLTESVNPKMCRLSVRDSGRSNQRGVSGTLANWKDYREELERCPEYSKRLTRMKQEAMAKIDLLLLAIQDH